MVGDAPGDLDTAKVNEVHFYPVLFGKEKKSRGNVSHKNSSRIYWTLQR